MDGIGLILYTSCEQCGELLQPSTVNQRTHPDCPPSHLDQLEVAFLAAVRAGDQATADALALTLDQAARGSTELLGAALAYARQGWPVFPCRAGDKVPATPHGFKDANTDLDRISRWWQRHPSDNIGVATGHLFDVIDVDYLGKPEALEWWMTVRDNSELEIDALATTPRGVHAYVLPSGDGSKSKMWDTPGVDYRGIGGYVVVPPSVRDDGYYQWLVMPSPRIKRM